MSSLAVTDKYVAVAKDLNVDLFEHFEETNHKFIEIKTKSKPQDCDYISDVTVSRDNQYLAIITCTSKELQVFRLPLSDNSDPIVYTLPRSASRIRFSEDLKSILVADKSGDAIIYNLQNTETAGEKILGHLSLLLDILQTKDENFIITSDRDEKIKVSCYPNTYSIHSYCLGHKEFVNHIEILPNNPNFLISTSGDGMIKIWNYKYGQLAHNIDTACDIGDAIVKNAFIENMDVDGLEVTTLPIVHCGVGKETETSSLIAVVHHNCCEIIIYLVEQQNVTFSHTVKGRIKLNQFPTDIKVFEKCIYVYDNVNSAVLKYSLREPFNLISNVSVLAGKVFKDVKSSVYSDFIRQLYKRKFDNVQEYQERKRQRLENK